MTTTREKLNSPYANIEANDLKLVKFIPELDSIEHPEGVTPNGRALLVRQADRVYRFIRSERRRGLDVTRPDLVARFRDPMKAAASVKEIGLLANVSMFEFYDKSRSGTVGLGGIIHNQVLSVNEDDNFQKRNIIGFDLDYILHGHLDERADIHKWAANALIAEASAIAQRRDALNHEIFYTSPESDGKLARGVSNPARGFTEHQGMQQVGGFAIRERSYVNLPFESSWQYMPASLHIAH
jgi:hypothetical protein